MELVGWRREAKRVAVECLCAETGRGGGGDVALEYFSLFSVLGSIKRVTVYTYIIYP